MIASRSVKNDMSCSHEVTIVRDPHRFECVSSMPKIMRSSAAYIGSEQVGTRKLGWVLRYVRGRDTKCMQISRGCFWDLSTHSLISFDFVCVFIEIHCQNDGSPKTRLRIWRFTAQIPYVYVTYKREVVSSIKIVSPDNDMGEPSD